MILQLTVSLQLCVQQNRNLKIIYDFNFIKHLKILLLKS